MQTLSTQARPVPQSASVRHASSAAQRPEMHLRPGPQSCAAVYGLVAPRTNACKAPGTWQSFDIEFHQPEYTDGRKTAPAWVTVVHNGIKVHDGAKMYQPTASALLGDASGPGPILLQGHGDPVQFRNIWLLPLQNR